MLNVLEDYLRSFQGALIIVSHDRYFMDKMVDHLFVFEGAGKIKDIIGNYTAYREYLKQAEKEEKEENRQRKKEEQKVEETKVEAPKVQKEKRKLSYKEKTEFEALDGQIMDLEEEKEKLTAVLSNPDVGSEELNEASKRLGEVVAEIEAKSDRWMELAEFV